MLAQSTQEIEPFRVILKNEVGSTNDIAREAGEPFVVVVADSQTKGRGRLQRAWFSPKGVNVYITANVPLPDGFPQVGLLSSTVALSVRMAILDILPELTERLYVKWPNDVYLDMKKLSGILIEKLKNGLYAVGIGINVNMSEEDLPPELRKKACSLRTATGKTFQRDQIIKRVLQRVLYYREILL
ncbi:MAG: biotin--[acetyl-CoA-carboxylase] ligase, partial [Nitrospirae bacterium]